MQSKIHHWNPVVYKDMVKWYQIFYTPRQDTSNIWKQRFTVQGKALEVITSKEEAASPWANFILFLDPSSFENEQQVEDFAEAVHNEVVKIHLSSQAFSFMIDLSSPLQKHLLHISQQKFCNTTYESYGMFLPIEKETPLPTLPTIASQYKVIPFTSDKELLMKFYLLFLETFGVPSNYIEKETETLIESTQYELTYRIIILDKDTTVATLSYTFSEDTHHTFLNEITVNKEYRKQGIGYYITVLSIHQMRQQFPTLKGVSLNATTAGFPLYEKMGFVYTSPIVYCQQNPYQYKEIN